MVRIKIKDLSRDVKVGSDEMMRILGRGSVMIGTWRRRRCPEF
jgi:hypothetical protein